MKFARKCSCCSKGMNQGYVIDGGINYYCSDDCLHTEYTDEQWNEKCKENPRLLYKIE